MKGENMSEKTIQQEAQGLALNDNLVGRDKYGERYYLNAEIKGTTHPAQTINHETLEPGAALITMSGHIIAKGCRSWHSGGQNLDQFEAITEFSNRWSAGELSEILAIWRAYHLNDLTSHCAHQDRAIKWDAVQPCSVTGYKAGSAWLYRPIPDATLITLTGLILKHRNDGAPASYNYEVQGYYAGHGWETLTTEETRGEAHDRLREYRVNERGLTALRIKREKVAA